MKKATIVFTLILCMSSCGVHQATSLNHNGTTTTVELSKKNFTIIEKVSGTSSATYILGFGGLYNKSLVGKAKEAMYTKANLTGTSRAIINQTTEEHFSYIGLYVSKTVTVSGYVVEFTQ